MSDSKVIALNSKYDLVLCLQCDHYITHCSNDSWSSYATKVFKHINNHRHKDEKPNLTNEEKSHISSFLTSYAERNNSEEKPSDEFKKLSSREGLLSPNIVLFKQTQPKIVEGYICNIDDCAYTNGNAKNWRQRMNIHHKKEHPNISEPSSIKVQLQELNLNTLLLIGRIGSDIQFQSESDIIFMDSCKSVVEGSSEDADVSRLCVLEKLEYYGQAGSESYVADWEYFIRNEVTLELTQKLFQEDISLKPCIEAIIEAWFQDIEIFWRNCIKPNYALREVLMKYDERAPITKVFKLKPVKTKGNLLLRELLVFGMNFASLDDFAVPAAWRDLFESHIIALLRELHELCKLEDAQLTLKIELVNKFVDNLTKAKYSLKESIATSTMPSAFLVAWIFRQGLERVQVNLRNVSSKAYAYENICRIFCARLYIEAENDDSVLDRIRRITTDETGRLQYRTSLDMAHQIFQLTSPFRGGQGEIKMEPITSSDVTLYRFPNGSLWGLDRQRLALSRALADFDEILYNLYNSFNFFDSAEGVFSDDGEILFQDIMTNNRQGYGLTVDLEVQFQSKQQALNGKVIRELLDLKRVNGIIKVGFFICSITYKQ